MTLQQIIADLDNTDDSLTIYADKPPIWTRTSRAELLLPARDRSPKTAGFPYFLEVSVAKNVLRAWSYVRDGLVPDLAKKCEAIIYYAENDAYILPEHEGSFDY